MVQVNEFRDGHCSFAYSALASFRMGMSGSASLQKRRLLRFKRQADSAHQVGEARVGMQILQSRVTIEVD